MNHVVEVGRLTRDPHFMIVNEGTEKAFPMCFLTIAVDKPFVNAKGEREADFLPVKCTHSLAEVCANNLVKGRLVSVHGRLASRSKTIADQTVTILEIEADEVKFLSPKAKTESTGQEAN